MDYFLALGRVVEAACDGHPALAEYRTRDVVHVQKIKDLGEDGVIKLALSLQPNKARPWIDDPLARFLMELLEHHTMPGEAAEAFPGHWEDLQQAITERENREGGSND